jgi:hypothetical protein
MFVEMGPVVGIHLERIVGVERRQVEPIGRHVLHCGT